MAILDLTTVARVKIVDPSYIDANIDAKISMYITAVSAKVAKFLNRTILTGTYTEYFALVERKSSFAVNAWPITSITSISELAYEADSNPYVLSTDDIFKLDNDLGIVHIENNIIMPGYSKLKIVYVGGMAATTAAFYANYPDIEQEVINQILYDLAKSKNFLDKSINIAGQVTTKHDYDILPTLQKILYHYKRKLGVF